MEAAGSSRCVSPSSPPPPRNLIVGVFSKNNLTNFMICVKLNVMKTVIVEKKKTTLHFPLAFEKYGICTVLKMDYDYPEKPKEDEGFILVDNNKQVYMPFTKEELLELCPYGKKGDTVLIKEKYSTGRGTKVKIIDVKWKTNPWCWEITYANK